MTPEEWYEKRRQQEQEKNRMDIKAFLGDSFGDRLPYLETAPEAKKVGKPFAGKITAVRPTDTPKFKGLFLDVKVGDKKYSKGIDLTRPIDAGNLARACKSTDTDDWAGCVVQWVGVKGNDGKKIFVNVYREPKKDKKGKK